MGLFDIFGTGDQQQAATDQIAGINSGLTGLTNNVNQGTSALTTNFTSALQPFLQNFNSANGGVSALLDALGVNGSAGSARAQQAFQNNPGIAVQEKMGDDAIAAADAASGKTASGNEAIALDKYNNNLAQTSWGQYVQSLMPFLGQASTAASGIGAVDTGLGTGINTNYNTIGNATYGADTSIGNANANKDLAGLNASANSLGAISGLASGLMGFLSDERSKDDIEPVGKTFDGQTVYRYRYKGDHRHQLGFIAQEVERNVPDATFDIPEIGMKGVDYKRATDWAAALGKFRKAA